MVAFKNSTGIKANSSFCTFRFPTTEARKPPKPFQYQPITTTSPTQPFAHFVFMPIISAPFPASLTYIGDYAFWGCTLPPEINLTDVNVGSKTCFCGTNGVKSITLTYTPNFDDSHLPKAQSFEHMKELETVKITTDFFYKLISKNVPI